MLFLRKFTSLLTFIGCLQLMQAQLPTAEELVGIHVLTAEQINAIGNPIAGTLVYNSDIGALQAFTGGEWEVPETISTFVDNMDGTFTYTDETNQSITIGTIGEQGPKGDKGDPGEQGPQGPAGEGSDSNLSQTLSTGVINYTQGEGEPQTANVISSDPNNSIAVGSDGGAYYALKFIDVYDSNNSYSVSLNSFVKIRLNTTRINQGGIFSLNNNEITVNENGVYEVEYGVSTYTIAQGSSEGKLQVNGVDVAASRTYNGGWYKRNTATRKLYLSLNANDKVSAWVQKTQAFGGSNGVSTNKDGSFLLIRKMD